MIYCITAFYIGDRTRAQLYEVCLPQGTTKEQAKELATTWLAEAHPEQKLWDVEHLPNALPRGSKTGPIKVYGQPCPYLTKAKVNQLLNLD
jgi:hypothetical protein